MSSKANGSNAVRLLTDAVRESLSAYQYAHSPSVRMLLNRDYLHTAQRFGTKTHRWWNLKRTLS
jgi:hypothetical protein